VNAPIFFDGMGQKAARIFLDYPEYLKDAGFLKKALKEVNWVNRASVRKKALKEPCVIVSSAGMLQGGPVLNYLKETCSDLRSKILLTGYQVKDTPGRVLLDTKKITIDGAEYNVKAQVEKFDFSAHASQQDMIKSVKKWNPEKILLVHGDEEVALVFKKKIEEETGIPVLVPKRGEKITL